MKLIIAVLVGVSILQQIARGYNINSLLQFKEFIRPSK
jgi:hypothetical protein